MAVTVMFRHLFLEVFFNTTKFIWWQKFTIRKFGQPVAVTRNACKFLNVAVPRIEILITYRPVNRKTVPCRSRKIEVAPALRVACPKQRLSTHLVTANPVEGFLLRVGVFVVLYKKVHRIFLECITLAYHRILLLNLPRYFTAVLKFPRHHVRGRIIDIMLYVFAAFQHKRFESFLSQFLCCPATADPGTNHDCIIRKFL